MPQYQAMVERANTTFNRDNLSSVDLTLFEQGKSLSASARTLGIAASAKEEAFLEALPDSVKESIRASIYSSLSAKLPVQMLWMPAGHIDVRTASVAGTADSIGGTSILITTPIPQ